jgi:hypothetical protein
MTGASSSVQLTPYRFTSAIGAAQNLCNILIELGSALLSVLEKMMPKHWQRCVITRKAKSWR